MLVEAEGVGLFEEVERLRRSAIRMREEPTEESISHLFSGVRGLSTEEAKQVVKAFGIYFQLANLAERHQRVRTFRTGGASPTAVDDSIE